LASVTKAKRKASALLTFCSTKILPSGPEFAAHFARKRAQWSVGRRDNDRRDIISDTYALKRQRGAIPFQIFPAYFGSKKAQTSVGPCDGLGF
jgi:hypothetical protein